MLGALDRWFEDRPRSVIAGVGVLGVALVGVLDFATGSELSFSVFYLGPVALAAWFGGRRSGVSIAVLSCVVWYLADRAGGGVPSHPAIPVWNALVRFGFFLTNALLLSALKVRLRIEERLARVDSLTGALNARAFTERLELELSMARRSGGVWTLAYVDLDDFKSVNDRFGHAEGDRVLERVGTRLRDGLRLTDAVGRLGGDEFAMLLSGTDLEGARGLIVKLRASLAEEREGERAIACSIGSVVFRDAPATAEEALHTADELMYQVKRSGKGALAMALFESGAIRLLGGADREV